MTHGDLARVEQGRSLLGSNAALSPVAACSRPRSFGNTGNRILAWPPRTPLTDSSAGCASASSNDFETTAAQDLLHQICRRGPRAGLRLQQMGALKAIHPETLRSRAGGSRSKSLWMSLQTSRWTASGALRLPQGQGRVFSYLVLELEPRHQLHGSASHGNPGDLADMSRTDQWIRQGEAGMVGEVLNFGLELEAHALTKRNWEGLA